MGRCVSSAKAAEWSAQETSLKSCKGKAFTWPLLGLPAEDSPVKLQQHIWAAKLCWTPRGRLLNRYLLPCKALHPEGGVWEVRGALCTALTSCQVIFMSKGLPPTPSSLTPSSSQWGSRSTCLIWCSCKYNLIICLGETGSDPFSCHDLFQSLTSFWHSFEVQPEESGGASECGKNNCRACPCCWCYAAKLIYPKKKCWKWRGSPFMSWFQRLWGWFCLG